MRRRAAIALIATAGLAVIAGAVVAPYVIAERGWEALQARVEAATRSRLTADGPVQGRLWPVPRLIVAGLEATAPGDLGGAPLVYADHAKIDIGWRALLTGRFENVDLRLRSVRVLALPLHPPVDIQGTISRSSASFTANFEDGTARATLRPEIGGLRLETLDLRAGGIAAHGSGRLMFGDGVRLVLGLDRVLWSDTDLGRADLAVASERDGILIERAALRAPDGSEATLFGLVTTAGGDLRFAGGIDGQRQAGGQRLDLAARVTARLGRESQLVEVDDVNVQIGASQLTGKARWDTGATPQAAAELRVDRLDLAALDPGLTKLLAPLLVPSSGELRVRVGELAWRDAAAQGVVIEISHRDRDFELRELAVRALAGASLHASGPFVRASDGTFVFNGLNFRYGSVEGKARLAVDLAASPMRLQADVQTGPLALDAIVPPPPPLPPEPMTRRAAAAAARQAALPPRTGWASDALPWPTLPPVTAELHLTAPSLSWRGLRLDLASVDGRLADDVLTIDQLSGTIFGGRVEIRGRAPAPAAPYPSFAGTMRLSDLDLRKILQAYAGIDEISGRLDGACELSGAGASPAMLIGSLNGKFGVQAYEGVISGLDLGKMSARLKQIQRPTDLIEVLRAGLGGAGRTPFRSLAGTFRIDRGVARTEDLRLLAAAGEGRMKGSIDLPAWSLDLVNELRLTEHPDLPPLALKLSGPIQSPRRVFDIERLQSGLLRRGRSVPR